MEKRRLAEVLIASRAGLEPHPVIPTRKAEAEGGCGVIGIASSVPVPGRHLLQALQQMRNRGNGKGGGIAAVGLDPEFFGVTPDVLETDYLLAIAYLDPEVRPQVEASHVEPTFLRRRRPPGITPLRGRAPPGGPASRPRPGSAVRASSSCQAGRPKARASRASTTASSVRARQPRACSGRSARSRAF